MLVTKLTKRLDVPHEKGEWIDVRVPGWKKLEESRRERTETVLRSVRSMGSEVMNNLPQKEEQGEPDPTAAYDLGVLLRSCILSWSYGEKVTPQAIDDLDEETAKWLVGEIVALCQYGATEQKNS